MATSPAPKPSTAGGEPPVSKTPQPTPPRRSAVAWLCLLLVLVNCSWATYHFQYESLPAPLSPEQAGKRGFSEASAMAHVEALTRLGPHPVGSDALDHAVQYVYGVAEEIKRTAHWEVNVEVDLFHAKSGANRLVSGLFKGKTLIYSDLKHVVVRVSPKYMVEAKENAILVSSHIDTVFSTEGAGDCSSCVAVMLELVRGISQWAHGFKNAVIFLFNTGEEEGLNGAHSFITQHPWSSTICMAIDLEAMGIGGKSIIFQSGPDSLAIEHFSKVAPYPNANIIAQDLFLSGAIKSATDFQVYKEVANLSGLDFAYVDSTAVYHTKEYTFRLLTLRGMCVMKMCYLNALDGMNDKLKLLKSGSLQHLGENMLAFLRQTAASSLSLDGRLPKAEGDGDQSVFFDILGSYMVVYRQRLASMLHNSVTLQALLIWIASLLVGGYPAIISLGLSFLSVLLMWIGSLCLSAGVAVLLPLFSTSPVPFVANPWLAVGLFGAPALLGALVGQHVGFLLLLKHLSPMPSNHVRRNSPTNPADLIKWESERWLFKAGFLQWLIILIVGNFYKVGSAYLALVWLVSPSFAYGLLEATLSPLRPPRQLKTVTLIIGLVVPVLVSAGPVLQLSGTLIGTLVRLDRVPGGTPLWLGNVVVALFISAIVCLMLVYLLSYAHLTGDHRVIVYALISIFGLSLAVVYGGLFPPFTDNVARAVNVVHVVEARDIYSESLDSYVSLFSNTPGKLEKEVEGLKGEGFVCGNDKTVDLVSFTIKYGCFSSSNVDSGWKVSEVPSLLVESDIKVDERTTKVLIDTKISSRWVLGINTEELKDFQIEEESQILVPFGNKSHVDGWHTIQFSGGKSAPTKFRLTLLWLEKSAHLSKGSKQLLKLRTDVFRHTPIVSRVLDKLPSWCSFFGKSTSPLTLSFLTSLPVDFSNQYNEL